MVPAEVSSVTETLFWEAKGVGDRPSSGGGGGGGARGRYRNDFFSHHIYCAQSKVEWGGGNGAVAGFICDYLSGPLPNVQRHITVYEM